jgi:hypothetical protein
MNMAKRQEHSGTTILLQVPTQANFQSIFADCCFIAQQQTWIIFAAHKGNSFNRTTEFLIKLPIKGIRLILTSAKIHITYRSRTNQGASYTTKEAELNNFEELLILAQILECNPTK